MEWILGLVAAFILGLSRGGLKGLAPVFILIMAFAFEGKQSSALIVPLLLVGDLLALVRYGKFIRKNYVLSFLPWVLVGVLLGAWIGAEFSDNVFKKWLSTMIIVSIGIMWVWDYTLKKKLKASIWLTGITGLGAGVFSILGNLAGGFANIYFLLTGLSRKELIGTATIVFFSVNLVKIPFHILVWDSITPESLKMDLYFLPAMVLGFYVGVKIIDTISEDSFRQFLYIISLIGALFVLFL